MLIRSDRPERRLSIWNDVADVAEHLAPGFDKNLYDGSFRNVANNPYNTNIKK